MATDLGRSSLLRGRRKSGACGRWSAAPGSTTPTCRRSRPAPSSGPAPNMLWALAEVYGLDLQDLLRLAGHVEAASSATPGSVVGAALRTMGDLTDERAAPGPEVHAEDQEGTRP